MNKIKILEVNNIDVRGNRFNGYNMISELGGKELDIKQAVIFKLSDNPKVIKLMENDSIWECYEKFIGIENELSIKNVYSVTLPCLMKLKEYKEADIIHFHQFHNTSLPLYGLRKVAKEKKVIISLHDPWFITGRCVHFYNCEKWKNGCNECPNLKTLFQFKEDNCSMIWNLKKNVLEDLDIDVIVSTDWMLNLINESPYMKNKNVYKIPFGINYERFSKVRTKDAKKHFNIPDDNIVLFLRASEEFKGTEYVREALKDLKTNKKITILTCDFKNLLDDVKDKYNVIDLGNIRDNEMIYAMNACDIFLMPSIGESFGMMAIEAMACKKPVIVFNNSALPSVTKAPECGYLVKNRDSNDLRKAIKYLVENEEERKRRGKLGYKIVKEEYTNEKYNERLRKMYLEVMKRKRKIPQDINFEETEETNQFKFVLNDLTVRFFGTTSKEANSLMFNTKDLKRDRKYKPSYDDLAIQEMIYSYTSKLTDLTNKEHYQIDHSKKVKIEKTLYFLKNNPNYFINMAKNIINRKKQY